jgi:steroid delta-isomerase-like uncharacterized protein
LRISEQNKELVRRYLERTLNEGDAVAFDELTSIDYVGHMSGVPDFDRATHKQLLASFRAAFPDLRVSVEDLIAEGDRVVNRGTYSGTHRGPFQGIPPTGKPFTVAGINVSRVADGQVKEDWTVIDMLGMLQQLGIVPAPGVAAG